MEVISCSRKEKQYIIPKTRRMLRERGITFRQKRFRSLLKPNNNNIVGSWPLFAHDSRCVPIGAIYIWGYIIRVRGTIVLLQLYLSSFFFPPFGRGLKLCKVEEVGPPKKVVCTSLLCTYGSTSHTKKENGCIL